MEHIDGRQLHEYIIEDLMTDNAAKAAETIVDLLTDVLSAMEYLHDNNAMHSDVKEANILVRRSSRPEAVLVDLGAAHVFAEPRSPFTTYITTRNRVTREWQAQILQAVPASELQEKRQYLDLLCFGSMLRLLLNRELPATNLKYDWCVESIERLQEVLGQGIVTLHRVADKCIEGKYSRAQEAGVELNSMREGYVSPLGVPELSIGTNAKTSLALPSDSLPLTERITSVLNHPSLQRLRRLPQLDFVSLIAVGATHSRLLHSLETYRLGRLYVGNLLGDPVFRAYCGEKHKLEAVLLASLIHDIGHYPLEHIFEDFAFRRETSGPFSGILRDEDVTVALLGEVSTESEFILDFVEAFIRDCSEISRNGRLIPLPELVQREFGEEVLMYLRQILGAGRPQDEGVEILRTLVSGPLDVDKVAYLQSDSYFSGVRYGRSVDVDSLLSSLTSYVGPEVADGRSGACHGSLAIREKGVCAAESIATARRWMFQRVYWHKTNRAMMAMLRYAPQRLLGEGVLTFEEYLRAVYPLSDIEAVKFLDKHFELQFEGREVENPALMIIDGRRSIYKELVEFSGGQTSVKTQRIRRYLIGRSCLEWSQIAQEVAAILGRLVGSVLPSDVLLDIPSAQRHDIGDVLVVDYDRETTPSIAMLSEVSDEFRSAREFFDRGAMSCRIFVHPELRRTLAQRGLLRTGQREVVEYLADLTPH